MKDGGGKTRQAAESESLRERLEWAEDAMESVSPAFCVFDDQGCIAYFNQRYPYVIGLPAEKIRPGMPVRELIAMARDSGYYDPARALEDLEREFWEKLSLADEIRWEIQRNGRTYVVHPGRTPRGYIVASFEDVTEQDAAAAALRQSEARLNAILESLPDCVKIFDAQGALVYINPTGLDMLEADDLETLTAAAHVPIAPAYLAEAAEVHERVMSGETVVWTYEVFGMGGRHFYCEARAVPFQLPDGSRAHLSITRDITERKMAEDALRSSEERLRLVQEAAGMADFENHGDKVSYCSDLFFDQVGLPRGDGTIHISKWLELVHPDDRDTLARKMEESLDDAELFEAEYRIIRPDNGEVRWISCLTKMLRDEQGKLVRTIGSHRDVTETKRNHEALSRNEERLRLVKEATGLADFEAGPDGVAYVSPELTQQLGLPPGTTQLPFNKLLERIHPEDREGFASDIRRSIESLDTYQCEFRIIHGITGETRWILSRTKMERDENGVLLRSTGAHLDITERKIAEEILRESEERFRLAAEAAGLGVWDFDPGRNRRAWSGRLREIFGLEPWVPPRLSSVAQCICGSDRARLLAGLEALRSGRKERFDDTVRIKRADDGRERWLVINGWRVRHGDLSSARIIATVRDATEEKTAEERIRWSARHDPLTRVGNRTLFQEELDKATQAAQLTDAQLGVLLLDLDHFKQINDSLGHDVGDALLKMVAERLRDSLRSTDTVARLGGDEFAIIVPGITSQEDLVALSQSIQDRMRAPFVQGGRVLDCRVSAGAAIYPEHGRTPREVLKNADLALYAAKAAGRSCMAVYEPSMGHDLQRKMNMVGLARDAIGDDRIIPYYQPKLDLVTGAVCGFEALLRWRTPSDRIGQPATLAAAFEDLEVAAQISDRMIERTIEDIRGWLDRGVEFHHVAVNASPAEFRRDDFAERILDSLQRHSVPPQCFQIEITETVFLGRGADYVHRALARLSACGIKIALDDFGTGYASLRHLKQFPVDIIKIDQSFVRDMEVDPGDEAIVRAVINLGRSLGIRVVAEGIESATQAERLVELGCDYGQGFLFSKAVPPARVPNLISRWQAGSASAWHPAAGRALRLVASRT